VCRVAVEGKAILSQYITNKQSGSEVAARRGQYATSFPYQARTTAVLSQRYSANKCYHKCSRLLDPLTLVSNYSIDVVIYSSVTHSKQLKQIRNANFIIMSNKHEFSFNVWT